jgi:hypothetical protein
MTLPVQSKAGAGIRGNCRQDRRRPGGYALNDTSDIFAGRLFQR